MGFNFKKSVNLGGGLKLNVGKKSIGLSAGIPGLRISANSKTGTSLNGSIPGTGISFRQKISSPDIHNSQLESQPNNLMSYDDLLKAAYEIFVVENEVKISLLQRRLRLKYSEASLVIDELEKMGLVGPYNGSSSREIYKTH